MKGSIGNIDLRKWPTKDEYDQMTELERRVRGRLSWGDYDAIRKMGVDVEYLKETGFIKMIEKRD